MRVLELFAGAGGAYLGLRAAGLKCAAAVEWDAWAAETLRAAGAPAFHGDVRDLASIEAIVGPLGVRLLWSSFPCQAWSSAGKRLGARDERNGWPWTVDAIDRFRPVGVLCENVVGLSHHKAGCIGRDGQEGLFGSVDPMTCPGCYLHRVILPDLRARFAHAGFFVLDAADFGVPQHRRRLILWAGPSLLARPVATHGPDAGKGAPGWVSMRTALGLGEAGHLLYPCGTTSKTAGGPTPDAEPAPAVTGRGNQYLVPMRTGRHEDGRPALPVGDDPAPPVLASYGEGQPWTRAGHPWVADGVVMSDGPGSRPELLERPSPTVSAVGECKGSGPGGHPEKMQRASDALYLATGRRRLTWQECAVLQDFPTGHPFAGPADAKYRQIGNAVPPRLAEVVGRAALAAWGER
jgi:DNA (cytosine-5)-methyltransferase 1